MIKLLKYIKPYWYFAILAPLFMLGEVFIDVNLPRIMQIMIDDGVAKQNMDVIISNGTQMLIYVLIGAACGILSGVFTNLTSQNFANDLRKTTFDKIINLSFEQSDKFTTGSLITRVTNDITAVQNMVAMAMRMFVRTIGLFIFSIIMLIDMSADYALILLVVLPLEILLIVIFLKKAFPMFGIVQQKLDKLNSVVHENVTGARVVKAFTKEDYEEERFGKANQDLNNETMKVNKLLAVIFPFFSIFVNISIIAILVIGGNNIITSINNNVEPTQSIGKISSAITYISMILMSLLMLAMIFSSIARAMASAKRIREILDSPVVISNGYINENNESDIKGTIEFRNVTFYYPNGKGNPVLDDVSFKVNTGETVAIVGATGSGKSTIVNLLGRFYDRTSGDILINNHPIQEYDIPSLRNKMSIVLQKTELFSDTIKGNIKWGKEDATDEEVYEAARIAQADHFILKSKNGYETKVEERGTSLSGGQKQRMAIARAIIRKPEIIIFDDSTSALDLVTEAKLYETLKEKMKDATTLMIAQRIATARHADKIIVLENGKIVGFDNHEELMKSCKVYQDIYNSQLKGEVLK